VLKILNLAVEQIKRSQDSRIKSQPNAFSEKHLICQDLKKINISYKSNSRWSFADAMLNVVEVGRVGENLFQSTIIATTSSMTPEPNPRSISIHKPNLKL
jgi:hypothetical protein